MATEATPPQSPAPPAKTTHVRLLWLDNGGWRWPFFGAYAFFLLTGTKSLCGVQPSIGALLFLHAMWFVWAAHFADVFDRMFCADEDARLAKLHEGQLAEHQRALVEELAKRPWTSLKRNPETDTLEPVYKQPYAAPVQAGERMIDRDMGVRPRP